LLLLNIGLFSLQRIEISIELLLKSSSERCILLVWFERTDGRKLILISGFKLVDEVLHSFEMFDWFPGALTGGVSLPFDLVLDELRVSDAFSDDPLNFVEICHRGYD
jgi:hypothetical protein